MNEPNLTRFGISIPNKLLKKFDTLIDEKGYTNRSEAIRDLIRNFLVEEEWGGTGEVVGSLTLVYDHDVRGVSDKLTEMQHSFHGNIISSMHVHLDEHNCMEVLVIAGSVESVKKIASSLVASRGVKHGKLVMTTKGKNLD
ncbi:MAG TPA: nickel-responsive transcriptional regulator NikR [Euryarchaeota archaeon]|nr:putative nickel-responsive regulator [archaeon BMS3Abin16]GBE56984.1 putative nickel-responsive regulator [archaeon BMS3Bbin16]HDH27570.1 nickel-responsive transcriptional regulator NikR [Euryarchaeota archaeon]HDY73695.1 nickel-responsive transcriptional regulator NikR [Euryarchaeota archaeon]